MQALFDAVQKGETPGLEAFLEALGPQFPLLLELKNTIQDPIWHAEGNVEIHTGRVLDEIYRLLSDTAAHLNPEERLALVLGAVFHDVAKPITTRRSDLSGQSRIVAPGHAGHGRSYIANKLVATGLSYTLVQQVMALVGYHHHPRKFVRHEAGKGKYWELAEAVNLELLYYLALADIRGRDCDDKAEQLEVVELFKLFAEEHQVWANASPYREWDSYLSEELKNPDLTDLARGNARFDHAKGLITTPEEALARSYKAREGFGELILLCGASGSGKSTWVKRNLPDAKVVSLDDLREQIAGKREDQSMNGQVLQAAKEQIKQRLRQHRQVVWDATNLRRDFRAPLVQLGLDYGALVTLVVFQLPEVELFSNNRQRAHAVPEHILARQLEMLEFPHLNEAHRTIFVGSKGVELARYGFITSGT